MSMGPLSGVKVLDLSTTFLGPYCTLLMAQMGADVIKVESPTGDVSRQLGPRRNEGMGSIFLNLNRGKRSVVLDLKTKGGSKAFADLASAADVVVHNMRPGTAERLGCGYESVRQLRPDVVYCAAYGFGEDGPYAGMAAYDDVIQGVSGVAELQGRKEGRPQYVVTPVADKTVGLAALAAILGALYHRAATGEGQSVDVPMFETMASYTLLEQMGGWVFDPPDGEAVYPRLLSPHRIPFTTADGHVCVVVYTDEHWRRFLELVGRSDLLEDERFRDLTSRTAHIDHVYATLGDVLRTRSTQEWLEHLPRIGVPCTRVNSVQDLFTDPHLEKVGFFAVEEHPSEGRVRVPDFPMTFSATPGSRARPAPRLGEHTRDVLAGAGYSEDEIQRLKASGAVRGV